MPRSKSIPGSKPSRAKANTPQADAVDATIAGANSTAVTRAEALAGENATAHGVPTPPVAMQAETKVKAAASSGSGTSESKSVSNVHRPEEAKKPEESRKLEVVKTDSRKNLVPINLEDEIRRRAYELYEQRGTSPGSEADDWFVAEREVRQRYRQQSA
jgi:hypothetical protein